VRDVVWAPLSHGARRGGGAAGDAEQRGGALFGRFMRFIGTTRELSTSRDPFPWAALERLVQEAGDELV